MDAHTSNRENVTWNKIDEWVSFFVWMTVGMDARLAEILSPKESGLHFEMVSNVEMKLNRRTSTGEKTSGRKRSGGEVAFGWMKRGKSTNLPLD